MDRERLQQVHATDLTESRVNQEFVDWLKTKGMSWLLAILVAMSAWMFYVRMRDAKTSKRSEAWIALSEASTPSSKDGVAEDFSGVFGVPQNAHIAAGEQLMMAVQRSQPLDAATPDPTQPIVTPPKLTDAEREAYLERAAVHFNNVVEDDNGELGMALYVIAACNGLAAIEESRGNADGARAWYEKAAERAGTEYPELAEHARDRIETVETASRTFSPLKSQAELSPGLGATATTPRTPLRTDSALEDLIFGNDDADATDG